jgi:hypothetical protein
LYNTKKILQIIGWGGKGGFFRGFISVKQDGFHVSASYIYSDFIIFRAHSNKLGSSEIFAGNINKIKNQIKTRNKYLPWKPEEPSLLINNKPYFFVSFFLKKKRHRVEQAK